MSEEATLTVEQQAEATGWSPDGAKSAEEWIYTRDNNMGAQRADIKKLEARVAEDIAARAEDRATIQAMAKTLEATRLQGVEQGYQNAIDDAKDKMRQAVAEADTDAYKAAEGEVEKLEADKAEDMAEAAQVSPANPNPLEAQVSAHMAQNKEIFANHFQTQEWGNALKFHGTNGMAFEDAMVQADKDVIAHFKLGKAMPGPGGDDPTPPSGGGGDLKFSDLPKADQQAYHNFAKDLDGYTKEQYMEVYNAS